MLLINLRKELKKYLLQFLKLNDQFKVMSLNKRMIKDFKMKAYHFKNFIHLIKFLSLEKQDKSINLNEIITKIKNFHCFHYLRTKEEKAVYTELKEKMISGFKSLYFEDIKSNKNYILNDIEVSRILKLLFIYIKENNIGISELKICKLKDFNIFCLLLKMISEKVLNKFTFDFSKCENKLLKVFENKLNLKNKKSHKYLILLKTFEKINNILLLDFQIIIFIIENNLKINISIVNINEDNLRYLLDYSLKFNNSIIHILDEKKTICNYYDMQSENKIKFQELLNLNLLSLKTIFYEYKINLNNTYISDQYFFKQLRKHKENKLSIERIFGLYIDTTNYKTVLDEINELSNLTDIFIIFNLDNNNFTYFDYFFENLKPKKIKNISFECKSINYYSISEYVFKALLKFENLEKFIDINFGRQFLYFCIPHILECNVSFSSLNYMLFVIQKLFMNNFKLSITVNGMFLSKCKEFLDIVNNQSYFNIEDKIDNLSISGEVVSEMPYLKYLNKLTITSIIQLEGFTHFDFIKTVDFNVNYFMLAKDVLKFLILKKVENIIFNKKSEFLIENLIDNKMELSRLKTIEIKDKVYSYSEIKKLQIQKLILIPNLIKLKLKIKGLNKRQFILLQKFPGVKCN